MRLESNVREGNEREEWKGWRGIGMCTSSFLGLSDLSKAWGEPGGWNSVVCFKGARLAVVH
jgi:hypothetical protein